MAITQPAALDARLFGRVWRTTTSSRSGAAGTHPRSALDSYTYIGSAANDGGGLNGELENAERQARRPSGRVKADL